MQKPTQRDLTRLMKAAKAAGFASFEVLDPASGLIFRSNVNGEMSPANDLIDIELEHFKRRVVG